VRYKRFPHSVGRAGVHCILMDLSAAMKCTEEILASANIRVRRKTSRNCLTSRSKSLQLRPILLLKLGTRQYFSPVFRALSPNTSRGFDRVCIAANILISHFHFWSRKSAVPPLYVNPALALVNMLDSLNLPVYQINRYPVVRPTTGVFTRSRAPRLLKQSGSAMQNTVLSPRMGCSTCSTGRFVARALVGTYLSGYLNVVCRELGPRTNTLRDND
jgi:hypothetical protein